MEYSAALDEKFKFLAVESRELYIPESVRTLRDVPSPLEFYRDYVAVNKPVIIDHVIDHWPALSKWDVPYLRDKIGDVEVTVSVTPNGLADAVYDGRFVTPEERSMKFDDFLNVVEKKVASYGVYYVQKQNSNFTDEFRSLLSDADEHLTWASEAFGSQPDAVNFWMGEESAVTSMHKDHYENLYCVVRGEKTFTLLPPTDQPFIPYGHYSAARYKLNDDARSFEIIDDPDVGTVPWIPLDPENPDFTKYPRYKNAKPLVVTVKAGQTLFLPSLWFHHVRQSHGCIAVNYWYDMQFDIKYCYYKFIESLIGGSAIRNGEPS
ncbi:bifunctional peptidase and (3S)-lysyl hydroxylase Jmjd7-like [Tubulanus polymorphus]|uniref:bifunctional peptidase and (3S)-lysyl hydroxylase Jmjd7-like n=1 Tax=Tubulanus polymorphus TaxID=672921 RepID=UPI003DA40E4D